jgi:hypothetical protein
MRRGSGSLFFAAALALAPGLAFGSLGSIISSFWVADNWWSYAFGVARDATYICWVTTERAPYCLYYRNPAGGGGMTFIGKFPAGHGDADVSVLGPGYFADIYREGTSGPYSITDFDVHTGSAVASWTPLGSMQGYAYNPALGIRYVGGEYGYVHRYNAAGSLLSSFPTAGPVGLAATNEFAGSRGEYIIVTKAHYWYVFTAQGVEIARVRFPWEFGGIGESACGPGYPSEYGTTLWCIALDKDFDSYVCQISLHNATAVAPASVGKIKALNR